MLVAGHEQARGRTAWYALGKPDWPGGLPPIASAVQHAVVQDLTRERLTMPL